MVTARLHKTFIPLFYLTLAMLVPGVLTVDVIKGYYHAWWAMVPIAKENVMKMLPGPDFTLASLNIKGLPDGTHPILLEMGTEHKCGPIKPEFLDQDFAEFKFDVPFVRYKDNPELLNYKKVIYQNSILMSESSKLIYGLNASKAIMTNTDNTYAVHYKDAMFDASFWNFSKWENVTYRSFPYFDIYKNATSQKWFGDGDMTKCAFHHYDYGPKPPKMKSQSTDIETDHENTSPLHDKTIGYKNQYSATKNAKLRFSRKFSVKEAVKSNHHSNIDFGSSHHGNKVDTESFQIRHCNMEVNLDPNVISPYMPDRILNSELFQPLGVVEVKIKFTMSMPGKCF